MKTLKPSGIPFEFIHKHKENYVSATIKIFFQSYYFYPSLSLFYNQYKTIYFDLKVEPF